MTFTKSMTLSVFWRNGIPRKTAISHHPIVLPTEAKGELDGGVKKGVNERQSFAPELTEGIVPFAIARSLLSAKMTWQQIPQNF